MQKKDTHDVMFSTIAVLSDAAAVFGGFLLAAWIRFYTFIPLFKDPPESFLETYTLVPGMATVLFLFVFRSKGLYIRPQTGSFVNKIPRCIHSVLVGILLTTVLAFSLQNTYDFARLVVAISILTISFFVVLERYILFRIEWNVSRHSGEKNNVLIIGCNSVAVHLKKTLHKEKMLRTKLIGFVDTGKEQRDDHINDDMVVCHYSKLESLLKESDIDQIILTDPSVGRDDLVKLILLCERNLITFNMVPDLFRIMTSTMDVQSIDDIPLLGIGKWPLDHFWHRLLKRLEDITCALAGLILTGPFILLAGFITKAVSPGPMFYKQERCGEHGNSFNLYKIRTMKVDAEKDSGPVFTAEDDPRRTKIGTILRKTNMDELPQLWNVLIGEMSLVGPRPERPHFVEQFKEDINRYMWRHVSKPGLTGWAQVNGLRGNTSIEERIKYDLYYLENWSLAFDFKIILKTFFARDNAY